MSMQSGVYRDMSVPRPGKNLVLAYVLWFFLGALGVHRFYVGHTLKGLYFLIATIIAVTLSAFALPVTFIIGGIIGAGILVFWIIDAFKLPKFVAATGVAVPSKTNE
jgi:TM2 domain-containing membrane protein YozV